jgi:hypothetical protein
LHRCGSGFLSGSRRLGFLVSPFGLLLVFSGLRRFGSCVFSGLHRFGFFVVSGLRRFGFSGFKLICSFPALLCSSLPLPPAFAAVRFKLLRIFSGDDQPVRKPFPFTFSFPSKLSKYPFKKQVSCSDKPPGMAPSV